MIKNPKIKDTIPVNWIADYAKNNGDEIREIINIMIIEYYQSNKNVTTYYGTKDPASPSENDLWYNSNNLMQFIDDEWIKLA